MYVRDQTLKRCVLLAPALKTTVSIRGWGECEKESLKSKTPQHIAQASEQLYFKLWFSTRVNRLTLLRTVLIRKGCFRKVLQSSCQPVKESNPVL